MDSFDRVSEPVICSNCPSYALSLVARTYCADGFSHQKYRCDRCGATGSLTVDAHLDEPIIEGAIAYDHPECPGPHRRADR